MCCIFVLETTTGTQNCDAMEAYGVVDADCQICVDNQTVGQVFSTNEGGFCSQESGTCMSGACIPGK